MTCGPWKPLRLEIYNSKIVDVHARALLEDNLEIADIEVTASIDGDANFVNFDLYLEGRVAEVTAKVSH
jgi:beta-mannosidase